MQKVASLGYTCHDPSRGMIALQTPYFIVHSDGAGFVLRIQRTGVDYPDIPSMERDMEAINAMLDRLGRDRKGLCIDWREGPLRNDAPFEEALRRVMPRLVRGYRAVSIIVRSAVGVLQAKRHFRESNLAGEVFQDEVEAMEYVRGSGGQMFRKPPPLPTSDRGTPTNLRGERMSTGQLQAIERAPPTLSGRGDRPSSLPPPPLTERPGLQGAGRDRSSSVPPPPAERVSQAPSFEDRASSLPPPPASLPRRTS